MTDDVYVHRAILTLKPGSKKPMPAGAEDLAELLVDRVRQYERNCRCPKCHSLESGPLPCVECGFCLANLRKLFLDDLTKTGSQPVASADFSCVPERRSVTFPDMKTKTRKANTVKAKGKAKSKAKSRIGKSPKPKAQKRAVTPKAPKAKKGPVSINSGGNGTQYDRQVFVRFDTPETKEMVRKAADATGASLSAYIAHFAVEAAKAGKELKLPEKKEEPVAQVS